MSKTKINIKGESTRERLYLDMIEWREEKKKVGTTRATNRMMPCIASDYADFYDDDYDDCWGGDDSAYYEGLLGLSPSEEIDDFGDEAEYWKHFFSMGDGQKNNKKGKKNKKGKGQFSSGEWATDDDFDDVDIPCKRKANKEAKKLGLSLLGQRYADAVAQSILDKSKNELYEDNDTYEDERLDKKEIRFYQDYTDADNYRKFDNLFEFDEFCNSQGIEVSETEVQNLMMREVSYCAINEQKRIEDGVLELITDSSYGGLRWSCATYDEPSIWMS